MFQNSLTPMGYYEKQNCKADTAFIIAAGAAGEIGYSYSNFWAADDCYFFKCSKALSSRYLYHMLLWKQPFLKSRVRKASIPRLSRDHIEQLSIPVPPLPVQEEIVRILDSFTKLEAELEAELEARRRQYEYYRDQLLNFNELDKTKSGGVKLMALGEITCSVSNISWSCAEKRVYQYIDLSSVDIGTHSIISTQTINHANAPSRAQQVIYKDDILFATTRPTQMRVCKVPSRYHGQICSTGFCVLRIERNHILPNWIFYNLCTDKFRDYLSANQQPGNYPSISNQKLKSYTIPVPSLQKQKEIISILDRFDALVNDLTGGLPAEIKARRQQYEYYRDKLFTFSPLQG